MTVADTHVVDFIGIDDSTDSCVLTISDNLPWGDQSHLTLLQEKLNTYLRFIESGEILASYPNSKGKSVSIAVATKFSPTDDAIAFLKAAQERIQSAGFALTCRIVE